jgi:predicted DNA-binding protein YlxM (UPF0122 family)
MFDALKNKLPKDELGKFDVSALTPEQKIELSLVWRTKGASVTAIAKTFEVSRRTIYQWIAKAKEHFLSNIEEMTHLELITEHDMMLESLENIALAELDRITAPEYMMDEAGQINVKARGSVKDISEIAKLALAIRQQRMQLHTTVGLIPRTADTIHHKISQNHEELKEEYEQSPDELRLLLVQKLNRVSRL